MSLFLFVFVMVSPEPELFKLRRYLSLPVSEPSPLKFELRLALTANSTSSTTLGTLNSHLLDLHAHHVPLEDVAQLAKRRRASSHEHGPRILEPGQLQLELGCAGLGTEGEDLQDDAESVDHADFSLGLII